MEFGPFGKWIFFAGVFIAAFGLIIWLGEKTGLPLGRLPGDINIRRDGFSFHFPIATSIIVSIALTVILNLVIKWFNR